MKLIVLLLFTSTLTAHAKSVIWETKCKGFDDKAFSYFLVTKCLDKNCKIKSTRSSMSTFAGEYKQYKFIVDTSSTTIKFKYPSSTTLGPMSEIINKLCPDLKINNSKHLLIKSLPNGYRNFVFHLSFEDYKSHRLYKQFNKSKDKCLRLNTVKEESSVVLFLTNTCKYRR